MCIESIEKMTVETYVIEQDKWLADQEMPDLVKGFHFILEKKMRFPLSITFLCIRHSFKNIWLVAYGMEFFVYSSNR